MASYMNSALTRGNRSRKVQKDLELYSAKRSVDSKCKFSCLPGKSKQDRSRKSSDFGTQLNEKQAVKFYYGLREKQFKNYVTQKSKKSHRDIVNKADVLLILLETRLDNLVYRMGFASTRRHARQMVSHGHLLVNGKRVDIPSYEVKVGDEISVVEHAQKHTSVIAAKEVNDQAERFDWIKNDSDFKGVLAARPDVAFLHQQFDVNLIIEFYSK